MPRYQERAGMHCMIDLMLQYGERGGVALLDVTDLMLWHQRRRERESLLLGERDLIRKKRQCKLQ